MWKITLRTLLLEGILFYGTIVFLIPTAIFVLGDFYHAIQCSRGSEIDCLLPSYTSIIFRHLPSLLLITYAGGFIIGLIVMFSRNRKLK